MLQMPCRERNLNEEVFHMFTERDMQHIIRDNPGFFFGPDVSLYQREFWVGTDSRIDFVFIDHKKKEHILVEVQIGRLDSLHSEKLWNRYVPNYRTMRPDVKIRPVLIANSVGNELLRTNTGRGVEVICYSTE